MEAARVSALKGHRVTVYEKQSRAGGRINTLCKAPGRAEFIQVIRYLETQLKKLNVEVRLNSEATHDIIIGEKPDVVIVATGAVPFILPLPGSSRENVIDPSQVLDGEVDAGKKVLVYESTGMQEGPTVADYLAEKGSSVEILTHFPTLCAHWGMKSLANGTHIPVIWKRLKKNHVAVTPYTAIRKISGKEVTVADVISGEERIIRDVDTVVMATGYRSENRLYKALKGHVKEVHVIGDCKLPRRALDAIHEGYMTAFSI